MKNSVIYTLKVWQTAVLLTPVMIMLTGWLGATNIAMGAALLIYGVFLGMLFSVPSAVLFASSTYVLNSMDLTPWHKNTILSLIGILSTLLAFLFMTGKTITVDGDYFCIPYASVIVAGIWFYKLEPMRVIDEAEMTQKLIQPYSTPPLPATGNNRPLHI